MFRLRRFCDRRNILIFDCSAIIIHIQRTMPERTQPVLRTAFHFRLIQVTQLAIDQLLVFFGPGGTIR